MRAVLQADGCVDLHTPDMRSSQYQSWISRSGGFHVWLNLLLALASSTVAFAALLPAVPATTRALDAEVDERRQEQEIAESTDPRAILAQVQSLPWGGTRGLWIMCPRTGMPVLLFLRPITASGVPMTSVPAPMNPGVSHRA